MPRSFSESRGGCEPVRTGMVKFTWELPAERTVVR